MFSRILVPTDFSEPSDAALEYARGLARQFGASLHLLHVVEDRIGAAAFGTEAYIAESPESAASARRVAEQRLAARLRPDERTTLGATTQVRGGPSAETIIETAEGIGCDLIVMGTHGRTGLAHAFMGSVAERVVRLAPCPVLTVHAKPSFTPVAIRHTEPGFVVV